MQRQEVGGSAARTLGRDVAVVAAVVLGAVIVALAVGIDGEFPLNDDWSYAWAARGLCRDGELRLLQWTGASVVAQVAYGALLCRVFGFSFTVLRVSTLVLATASVVAWAAMLRRLGVAGICLAIAIAVVALDPITVNLAFTFMTDVPFTAFGILAGACYLRGLEARRNGSLLAGAVLAAIALLVRQHGIFIVAAAALAIAVSDGRPWRDRIVAVVTATAIPIAAFVGYHAWLFGLHGAPSGYTNKIGEAQRVGVLTIANCAFRGVQYLGFLTAPLAPFLARDLLPRRARSLIAWTIALGAGAVVLWVREGALLFDLPNVLYDFGVGPLSLRDVHVLGMPAPTRVGLALRVPVTVSATLSAAVLCTAATETMASFGARRHDVGLAFLAFAAALLFAGTLLQAHYYFDRYLLPVVPFAVAALAATRRGRASPPASPPIPVWSRAAAGALAAALAWLAVAGTHDYLAWNRARFAGLDHLAAAGVPPTEIDGGFEFNAWHLAPTFGHWPSDEEARVGQPASRRSWWWVVDDRYVVSFHELAGYTVRDTLEFSRWLVPGLGRIYVLERVAR